MAKAKLIFDLGDPDDAQEHRYALAGRDALLALEAIESWAMGQIKHCDHSEETERVIQHLRDHLIPRDLTELLQ